MRIPNALPPEYGIYALIDPTDGLVYYVGQTSNPRQRLLQHLAARHHEGAKAEWLRCLDERGQKPLLQILEIVVGRHMALTKEREWIRHFQEQGMPLFNTKRKPGSKPSLKPIIPILQDTFFVRDSRDQPPTDSESVDQPENEERRQREERILDATVNLLLRWGHHKTTLDDVAHRAGVGTATSLHWKDKSELFQAAIQREGRRLSEDIKQRIAADPEGGLFHRQWAHGMLALFSNLLMVAILKGNSHAFKGILGSYDQALLHQVFEASDVYLAQLQQAGQIRADLPVPVITFLIGALKIGIINLPNLIGQEQIPPMERLTEAISDLMRLWLEPEQLPRNRHGKEHEMS